jgi:hypothetical protein
MNIEDALNNSNLNLNMGDILEKLLLNSIANNLLSSAIIKQQLEIKELIKSEEIDNSLINEKYIEILNAVAEQSTNLKNEELINLYKSS